MIKLKWEAWSNHQNIGSREFICGFCAHKVAPHMGYSCNEAKNDLVVKARIYICTNCGWPTFFDGEGTQRPGPMLGREVKNLPDDIKTVYFEIRESIKNSCFTSAMLLGRKLIMHIAVDIAGAKEGDKFVNYIEHLKKIKLYSAERREVA